MEQHQIDILKALLVIGIQLQRWLAVLDIIIGKIPNQSAGKGRHEGKLRTVVLLQNSADSRLNILSSRLACQRTFDCHISIVAGNFQKRVITQKSISSPLLVRLRAFQQINMTAHLFQLPQNLYGGCCIRIQLCADRYYAVFSVFT